VNDHSTMFRYQFIPVHQLVSAAALLKDLLKECIAASNALIVSAQSPYISGKSLGERAV